MSSIKIFESKKIRSEWSEVEQKWYFAIIDVIEILTESNNPRRYWSDLKRKLNTEGFSQLYEIIVQLKGTVGIFNSNCRNFKSNFWNDTIRV